jgi:hypothetical protein
VVDDLEIREDLGDFLAAVADFREDILGEPLIDQTTGLEKFDDLLVVHGTVKTEKGLKSGRGFRRSIGV